MIDIFKFIQDFYPFRVILENQCGAPDVVRKICDSLADCCPDHPPRPDQRRGETSRDVSRRRRRGVDLTL